MSLSEEQRRVYEECLRTSDAQEQQEILKKLIPGSLQFYDATLNLRLRVTKGKLTAEDQKLWDQLKEKFPHSAEYAKLQQRKHFYDFDNAEGEQEKSQHAKRIASASGFDRSTYKPAYLSEVQGNESNSEEDSKHDEERSTLDAGKLFPKKDFLVRLYEREHESVPENWEHEIDFSKLKKSTFESFVQGQYERIANIENESFWGRLQVYIEESLKQDPYFQLQDHFYQKLTLKQMDKVKGLHPKIKDTATFVGSYFKKNFFEELSTENQEEVFTPLEIRANLKRMLAFAKEKKMP